LWLALSQSVGGGKVTHIICRATPCIFWEQGVCGAEEIEYELDEGCLTFQDMGDLELQEDDDEDLDWEDDSDASLFAKDDKDGGWDDDGDWDDDYDL
jgi:hypothetical protein